MNAVIREMTLADYRDGRRGYVSHLAVADSHRRSGVGRKLVGRCIELLDEVGIQKCHVMVFNDNHLALSFWSGAGWTPRPNVSFFSLFASPDRRQE